MDNSQETLRAQNEALARLISVASEISEHFHDEVLIKPDDIAAFLATHYPNQIGIIDAEFRFKNIPWKPAFIAAMCDLGLHFSDTIIQEIQSLLRPTAEDFRIDYVNYNVKFVTGYETEDLLDANCNVFQLEYPREYDYDIDQLNTAEREIARCNQAQLGKFVEYLDQRSYPKQSLASAMNRFDKEKVRLLKLSREESQLKEEEIPVFSVLNFTKSNQLEEDLYANVEMEEASSSNGLVDGGVVLLNSMILYRYTQNGTSRSLALQIYTDLGHFRIQELAQFTTKVDRYRQHHPLQQSEDILISIAG